MDPFQLKDETTLMLKDWMNIAPQLTVGMTTRKGGVSPAPFHSMNLGYHVPDHDKNVINNRQILANLLNLPLDTWTIGEQVHGTKVFRVANVDSGKGSLTHENAIQGVDGLITKETNLLCTALFADCVPIFYFDPVTNWIGIAHAGWRGTVNGMAKQMVEQLKNQGVEVRSLLVAIGPCISQAHYEVDTKVIQSIPETLSKDTVKTLENGRFLLDLRQLNKQVLVDAGIPEHHISVTEYCTYRDDHLFYSHRRDQGKTGRMLGFIGFSSQA
ncbi:peptidoglycan editing factor PgeF [Aquibacillus sediminis]|uniref:peptidoglycan editing factor PgeF n=1 Tax=Aquibacillus sediminis TaxID=2574734 RepID=UPI001108D0BA|nr:peptidoglycan editing factor PgeF [Aquibacillus sediminis]